MYLLLFGEAFESFITLVGHLDVMDRELGVLMSAPDDLDLFFSKKERKTFIQQNTRNTTQSTN